MIKADFLNTAWVLIPATGVGERSGLSLPKQYFKINHKTVLNHTIDIFLTIGFKNILVILNPDDIYYQPRPNIHTCIGGKTRYLSVGLGLEYLKQKNTDKNTWLLVHDAVRPCLHISDLSNLINKILPENISGGILGVPVTDTLKSAENNIILNTHPRDNLWQALTPQMFKLGLLEKAYVNIKNFSPLELKNITDEAYLIEKIGLKSLMIRSEYPNPKLTYAHDIDYIKFLLEKSEGISC
jgi:2-C-methyl-D-erythritol 4-phosphate cytidylyltransferase